MWWKPAGLSTTTVCISCLSTPASHWIINEEIQLSWCYIPAKNVISVFGFTLQNEIFVTESFAYVKAHKLMLF